jgi:hypothetical protein
MPVRLVKSFAKKTGKDITEVERKWEKSKKLVADEYGIDESDSQYYSLVVGSLKKMLGIKESYLFADKFKKLLREV